MRIELKKCSNDPGHLEDGSLFYKCIRNRLRGVIGKLTYTISGGAQKTQEARYTTL